MLQYIFKIVWEINENNIFFLMISKKNSEETPQVCYLNCTCFLHQTPKVGIIWPAYELVTFSTCVIGFWAGISTLFSLFSVFRSAFCFHIYLLNWICCIFYNSYTGIQWLVSCQSLPIMTLLIMDIHVLAWLSNYNSWCVPSQLVTTAKSHCLGCEVCNI